MSINNIGILKPFGEPDYTEAALKYRGSFLMQALTECVYFKPLDPEIDLSKIARGGILHRIRNSPGVNIYVPGYCNVMVGYFTNKLWRIPFPYLLLSERNRDLRMFIFSEAAAMKQFLMDIRNSKTKFDNYIAEGLGKGISSLSVYNTTVIQIVMYRSTDTICLLLVGIRFHHTAKLQTSYLTHALTDALIGQMYPILTTTVTTDYIPRQKAVYTTLLRIYYLWSTTF